MRDCTLDRRVKHPEQPEIPPVTNGHVRHISARRSASSRDTKSRLMSVGRIDFRNLSRWARVRYGSVPSTGFGALFAHHPAGIPTEDSLQAPSSITSSNSSVISTELAAKCRCTFPRSSPQNLAVSVTPVCGGVYLHPFGGEFTSRMTVRSSVLSVILTLVDCVGVFRAGLHGPTSLKD